MAAHAKIAGTIRTCICSVRLAFAGRSMVETVCAEVRGTKVMCEFLEARIRSLEEEGREKNERFKAQAGGRHRRPTDGPRGDCRKGRGAEAGAGEDSRGSGGIGRGNVRHSRDEGASAWAVGVGQWEAPAVVAVRRRGARGASGARQCEGGRGERGRTRTRTRVATEGQGGRLRRGQRIRKARRGRRQVRVSRARGYLGRRWGMGVLSQATGRAPCAQGLSREEP